MQPHAGRARPSPTCFGRLNELHNIATFRCCEHTQTCRPGLVFVGWLPPQSLHTACDDDAWACLVTWPLRSTTAPSHVETHKNKSKQEESHREAMASFCWILSCLTDASEPQDIPAGANLATDGPQRYFLRMRMRSALLQHASAATGTCQFAGCLELELPRIRSAAADLCARRRRSWP
jgi:hypothetical protein